LREKKSVERRAVTVKMTVKEEEGG